MSLKGWRKIEVDLRDILSFYAKNFCEKDCLIETNYKKIGVIQISFSEDSLHHLLGLHYVTSNRASANIAEIKKGKLSLSDLKKNDNFYKIKYRLEGVYSLSNMLIKPKADVCILEKDLHKNPMNLDLVLFEKNTSSKLMILGLRKNKTNGIYYPTTLLRTEKYKYAKTKLTKINNITWI